MSYTQVRRMCERIERDAGFTEKITPKRFRTKGQKLRRRISITCLRSIFSST